MLEDWRREEAEGKKGGRRGMKHCRGSRRAERGGTQEEWQKEEKREEP